MYRVMRGRDVCHVPPTLYSLYYFGGLSANWRSPFHHKALCLFSLSSSYSHFGGDHQGERTDLNGTYLTEEGTQAPPLSSVSLDTSVRCDTQPSWPTNGAWRLEQVAQRQSPDWRGRAKSQVSDTQAPQLLEPALS